MIRKPIDLHRIHQKILTGNYDSLESMLLDVTMMFDNAMLFNEPDSVLYKVSTRHPVFRFTPKMVNFDSCITGLLYGIYNEFNLILFVFQDAAVLLNEFLKRFECLDDQSQYRVPVISDEVQKMLHSLYHSTVNHQVRYF